MDVRDGVAVLGLGVAVVAVGFADGELLHGYGVGPPAFVSHVGILYVVLGATALALGERRPLLTALGAPSRSPAEALRDSRRCCSPHSGSGRSSRAFPSTSSHAAASRGSPDRSDQWPRSAPDDRNRRADRSTLFERRRI